jgi:hypothetical protein
VLRESGLKTISYPLEGCFQSLDTAKGWKEVTERLLYLAGASQEAGGFNPWHVHNLATDIQVNQLHEYPAGCRRGNRVELAFRHHRKAAYELLTQQGIPRFDTVSQNLIKSTHSVLPNMPFYSTFVL